MEWLRQPSRICVDFAQFIRTLGSCCALHGKPFEAQLALRQFVPPYLGATLIKAVRELASRCSGQALVLQLDAEGVKDVDERGFASAKTFEFQAPADLKDLRRAN
ncbi:MAG: hypothetical protein Q7U13_08200 [Rhodoferax sp.]|nr:hypothetical protein [Rhodoferax sp.]